MNTIEIATAHNIVFRYELATTLQRILAFVVDAFIILMLSLVLGNLFSLIGLFAKLAVALLAGFYHLCFEVFNQGQSPGKMLVKLRVVTLKGGTPTPYDYLLRWVFRLVDIAASGGSLAVLFVASSERNQRIGDMLAQTTVISLHTDLGVTLESLNGFNAEQEIEYPGVVRYNDHDMLFLKLSINRYIQYPNETNKQVLMTLTDNFVKDLDLEGGKYSVDFLKQLLSEYIVLTR